MGDTALSFTIKRKVAVGVTALAAAAFAGGAYAATQQSPSHSRQAFLNDVAKRLHVSPQQLTSAIKGAAIDQVNAAVAAGKLTQAQANAIKQRIQQQAGAPLGPLFFAVPGAGAAGVPGLHGWGHLYGQRGGGSTAPKLPAPRLLGHPGRGPLAAAASYLGLTAQQLVKELGGGKSLAQIATQRGKTTAGLKQAMIAGIKARLDQAVAAKMLTSAQEQKLLSRLSTRVDSLINRAGLRPFAAPRAFRPGIRPAQPRLFPSYGGGSVAPAAPLAQPPAGPSA